MVHHPMERIMKKLIFACLVAAACSAHSSFELVLVADNETNSVHRFDGVTGAYFGSFGAGDGYAFGLIGLAVNQNTGRCYTGNYNDGVVREYDYSTGLLLREVSLSGLGSTWNISLGNNGDLLIGTSSGGYRYNSNFVFQNKYASNDTASLTLGPDGNVYSFDRASNVARRFSYAGGAQGTTTFGSVGSPYSLWQSVTLNGTGWVTGNSGADLRQFSLTGPPTDLGSKPLGSIQACNGIAVGHGSTLFASGKATDGSGSGILNVYSVVTGSPAYRRSYGKGILKTPYAVASVVAPEPAGLLALTVGVGLLARRRRSAS